MDNTKKSFFRRPSDATPSTPPAAMDRQDWSPEAEHEDLPRPARRPFTRPDRGSEPRAERKPRADDRERKPYSPREGRSDDRPYAPRAPRGERPDFRRDDKRRPEEPKEAPENVIYGIHPLREALEAGNPIEKIYLRRIDPSLAIKGAGDAIREIEELAAEHDVPVQWVPVEKLDRLTRRNNHQGVVAVVPPIEYKEITEILESEPRLILVLDGITDVRNFGAIARSAECAGVDAIVIGAKSCAPINGEAMKSSAGALGRIPVARVGSLRNTLKTIQLANIQLVAATEKGSTSLFKADLTAPCAIIMGSEEHGISADTLKLCDQMVNIPLRGAIESLNVSAAAAVLLFEVLRQRNS
ncbi:MAG: 23S rRNA (guanosine(2251)-2'-O)-methyltransferase RlmB [Mucinivorans sp.]